MALACAALPGRPYPLGSRQVAGGTGFSVHSHSARQLELLLYGRVDDVQPARVIKLDPARHRTGDYWRVFVPCLRRGRLYASWRAHGDFDPARGLRLDPAKVLLDPYGRAVAVPADFQRAAAHGPGHNDAQACKRAVCDDHDHDWQGDAPLRRPFVQTVIYELHLRGFTQHPSSGATEALRDTYAGPIEKRPYLRDLCVTAIELMPVFQFDPQGAPEGLVNHWAYSPISLFAPHAAYASPPGPLAARDEFRDMVKAEDRTFMRPLFPSPWHPEHGHPEHGRTWHSTRLNLSLQAAVTC